jgi:hypothetical protein
MGSGNMLTDKFIRVILVYKKGRYDDTRNNYSPLYQYREKWYRLQRNTKISLLGTQEAS